MDEAAGVGSSACSVCSMLHWAMRWGSEWEIMQSSCRPHQACCLESIHSAKAPMVYPSSISPCRMLVDSSSGVASDIEQMPSLSLLPSFRYESIATA